MTKKILIALLIILVIMQFFGIDKTNPPVDPAQDFLSAENVNPEMATMIRTACYDCHSNETEYPWYTSIAPFSWWINGHITEAREHLNFSEFKTYSLDDQEHILEECHEVLTEKEMPMLSYMIAHWDAWINDGERARMAAFFQSVQIGSRGQNEGGQNSDQGHDDDHEDDQDD